MLVAPKPIADQLRARARKFLRRLRDKECEHVWNYMITLDAMELISTTSFPVAVQAGGNVATFLDNDAVEGMSFAFQQDTTFPNDDVGVRTGFFEGLAASMAQVGWFELFEDESSFAFLRGSAGVLVADTAITKQPLILPFVEDGRREYKVDFEGLSAFSMFISARKLHRFGTSAMEAGEQRTALTMYELAARLSPTYTRLRELMWGHPFVGTLITAERKAELQAEYGYTLLAKDLVESLRADPKFAAPRVDLGPFMTKAFNGYERIIDTELDDQDLARLNEMDDDAIRLAIARTLNGVDRVEAEREARKPHTSAEIADMEVLVRQGEEIYHLLMPVKSGREIRENSVPVEVFYQILRPHMFFQNGIVVFITAKPCSQFLQNYVKQARDRLGWPIGIIEDRDLARLLKVNNQLPSSVATT